MKIIEEPRLIGLAMCQTTFSGNMYGPHVFNDCTGTNCNMSFIAKFTSNKLLSRCTEKQLVTAMRRRGWFVHDDGMGALCPKCREVMEMEK